MLATLTREEKIEYIMLKEESNRRSVKTVVGIIDPVKGHTHSITLVKGEWKETKKDPEIYLAAKLEPVLKSRKRFIIVIGGRGSGKSVGIADITLIDAKDNGAKTYCLREYQSSIKNSVHSLLKEEIKRLEIEGFEVQQNSILYKGEDAFQFAGLARNVDSIKSAHAFKRYTIEEAQFITEDSLNSLTPTARKKPKKGMPTELEVFEEADNVSMIFVANPFSSEDPFSKRFINPFKDVLDRDGFYEDELHLIVVMNHDDNPWYSQSGLEDERLWDYNNRPRALYDHIWGGEFNDSVENSLVMAEWFDACIDSHIKLGFEALGVKIAAHDPSDTGPDSKGYAERHGSVITDIQEKIDGDVNEGGDWALGLANISGVDEYTWDCDGLGVGLNRQTAKAFDGKRTVISMFKGSESPDNPDALYNPSKASNIVNQKTWKETVRNKRAQNYLILRDRIYRTYRAVVHNEYQDPAELISFSSDIKILSKLRAELCRMPVKPNSNGLFELYTKQEMKSKFKVASPNLADSCMMLMRKVYKINKPVMPQAIRPMRR